MAQAFIGTQTDGFIERWSYSRVVAIDRFNCTDLCCRFADVLAAEQSETELLEPCELEGRQSELQRLEEERKNYEGQLLRLGAFNEIVRWCVYVCVCVIGCRKRWI